MLRVLLHPQSGEWVEHDRVFRTDRRIPSIEVLEREMLVLVAGRQAEFIIKFTWQFPLTATCQTFARHYQRVRQEPPLCHDIWIELYLGLSEQGFLPRFACFRLRAKLAPAEKFTTMILTSFALVARDRWVR